MKTLFNGGRDIEMKLYVVFISAKPLNFGRLQSPAIGKMVYGKSFGMSEIPSTWATLKFRLA